MKRSILGAAALALVLSASAVQAQRPVALGVALGATLPTGDYGDAVDMGYHGMVTLGFSPPMLPVGVRVDGMFNSLEAKGNVDITSRILALTANATFGVPMAASPISPYLIGGLGWYQSSVVCDNCADDQKTSDLGFNVGVGTKFALAGFGTFAEIRYHQIMGDDDVAGERSRTAIIPISFGITF